MPRTPKIAPEFTRTREFIARYAVLPTPEDLDIITLWTMGTWTFSPASPAMPYTYPYLYITGAKGSGKTHLALDVFSYICRSHEAVVNVTGAALFRMLGTYDKETQEVTPHYPTLSVDEVDAVYASGGSNDEGLRGVGNSGYKRGSTVPRSAGLVTVQFPVFCPKVWIGIDNGRLPETLTDRCIRIDMRRATSEQMASIRDLLAWEVDEESAELKEALASWAKREAMILRDYNPPKIEGLTPRQWEIARSLVQLAKVCGIEDRIRTALYRAFTRKPEKADGKVALYRSIFRLFEQMDKTHSSRSEEFRSRVASEQIMEQLRQDEVQMVGLTSGGLGKVLKGDGIFPKLIRFPEDHPGLAAVKRREGKATKKNEVQPVARGYYRHLFDDAFMEYLFGEDDD